MKSLDKLKAIKNLYSSFPVKENLVTEGKYYVVISVDEDSFSIFDDTNHTRKFFKVEFNELFVNFSYDLESLFRQLEVCVKLNKDIPIRVYDYIIKRYKSFKRHYISTPDSFENQQFVGVSFDGEYYDAKLTAQELLDNLKTKYKTY